MSKQPKYRIWLSPPHMSGQEQRLVADAFESNWVAPLGPHVDAFEHELGNYIGMPSVAALSSGTAAIHLALLLLGIQRGDSVVCSSFTFAGSANPIVYCGAKPVFVDSEAETWNMSPALLEEALETLKRNGTPARAVILVALYGVPPQIDKLLDICAAYGVPVIEDAAEALGSTYRGKQLGSFGELSVLSFNGNKIITTSGGGALASRDSERIERARFFATQARDPAPHYEHSEIGYNYRMSNVLAAIGRGQLSVLTDRVARRREIFSRYRQLLGSAPNIQFPAEFSAATPNRWLTTVLFESRGVRDRVMAALLDDRVEARPLWKPMHMQPVFLGTQCFVNGVSERLFERGLCLPSGTAMSAQDQDEIAQLVLRSIR